MDDLNVMQQQLVRANECMNIEALMQKGSKKKKWKKEKSDPLVLMQLRVKLLMYESKRRDERKRVKLAWTGLI